MIATARASGVGLVVVSHSRELAEAAVALARQMVGASGPPIAVAAGTADGGLGTDAAAVAEALHAVARQLRTGPEAGVLVLMDLGSAVLSAELAVELAGELPVPVRLCSAPLVEGLVVAVVQAAGGASLSEVAEEAAAGLAGKQAQLGDAVVPAATDVVPEVEVAALGGVTRRVDMVNPHGLHARPAAALVSLARQFDARVQLRDLTSGAGPASARSITALSSLGASRGDELEISATGRQAVEAVAALVSLVASGFGETDEAGAPTATGDGAAPGAEPVPDDTLARSGGTRIGVAASSGLGVGRVWLLDEALPKIPAEPPEDPAAESAALTDALAAVRETLAVMTQRSAGAGGPAAAAIFEAHALLLDDDDLLDPARDAIAAGAGAARAWADAVAVAAGRLDALADPYLRTRATDVRGVGRQVLRELLGTDVAAGGKAGVLLAGDVAPDDVTRLDPGVVTGIVTATGSPTSHAAILARSLGIPMVVAAGAGVLDLQPGVQVIVDGDAGTVEVDPDAAAVADARARIDAAQAARSRARERAQAPAVTTDGVHVEVEANVRSSGDAVLARAAGADGVGLLRTEFLFLDRAAAPTQAEQVEAYEAVATAMAGRRVTIRTLDVGGDKPLPYVVQPVEANPFLGLRGLRLALVRPELLEPQLRAIVTVAARERVAVMFPMVTTVAEVVAARTAVERAAADLGLAAVPAGLEFGIMVEVPAAALRAAQLAPLVDFFSIGTNDLTQYTLAAERGNAGVEALADGLDPAVLRLVADVCSAAAGHGTRVAVCGELAADPLAVAVLIGLGVRELSVTGRSVPAVKDAVRAASARGAEESAARALTLGSAADVRAMLRS